MLSTRGVPKRQLSLPLDQVADRPIVKQQQQNNVHPDHWIASARFWDTLPRIRLTRRALAELDRRNRRQRLKLRAREERTPPPLRRSVRIRQVTRQRHLRTSCSTVQTRPEPELQRFARGGGPDLTSIRGHQDPTTSDHTSRSSDPMPNPGRTTPSRQTGPYDANYEMKLAQVGVFQTTETDEKGDYVMPANYERVLARLNKPRPSLSPSRFTETDFRRFQQQAERASTESSTMRQVISTIEGQSGQFYSLNDLPFNNLELFDPTITITKPDHYDGARPHTINHRVRNDLNQYIIPNTNASRPAVPNFFLEGKSSKGRADVAKLQATHNGAIGARAITSLQSYPSGVPRYDRNAYTVTSTYVDGQLKMYTTHATAPRTPNGPPLYHMTQIRAFAMTDNSRTFREGATWYRNARDLAKEERDSAIQQANQAARQYKLPMNEGRMAELTDCP